MSLSASGSGLSLRREDEPLLVQSDVPSFWITCDDIARLAVAMHESRLFFIHRHGLKLDFCRDLNGSGTQALTITPSGLGKVPDWTLEAVFSPVNSGDYIYQADLLVDGRKDYDPVMNRGKHGFRADRVHMRVSPPDIVSDWLVGNYLIWESELDKVQLPHSTLEEWVGNGFHMWVICQDVFCHRSVLPNDRLKEFADAGLSLEELNSKMRCTQCGKRGARVKPC